MSETERQEWQRERRKAALGQKCPNKSCGAAPGRACCNRDGHLVHYFHAGRMDAASRSRGARQ